MDADTTVGQTAAPIPSSASRASATALTRLSGGACQRIDSASTTLRASDPQALLDALKIFGIRPGHDDGGSGNVQGGVYDGCRSGWRVNQDQVDTLGAKTFHLSREPAWAGDNDQRHSDAGSGTALAPAVARRLRISIDDHDAAPSFKGFDGEAPNRG